MKSRIVNLISAASCLGCAIHYTVTNGPLNAIVPLIILGLVNAAFVLRR